MKKIAGLVLISFTVGNLKQISFFGILLVIGCAIFISQTKHKNISGKVLFHLMQFLNRLHL